MNIKAEYKTGKMLKKLNALLRECKRDNDLRMWRRIKGILLFMDNKTPSEISYLLDVGFKTVYRWLNQYNEQGIEGLCEGEHTGRVPLLNLQQLARLEDILDSGPIAYGLTTGIWTCPTIQYIIEEEFNIRYHHDHVRKILHKLGFSVQRPRKKLALAEPQLQQKWVRRTYPALKKTAKR